MNNDYSAVKFIDAIDAVQEGNVNSFQEIVESIMLDKLIELSEDYEHKEDEPLISEARFAIKVNSKGDRRRKLVCGKGKKLVNGVCQIISGSEKLNLKKGHISMAKTKRNAGAALQIQTNKKTKRAKTFRVHQGLKT